VAVIDRSQDIMAKESSKYLEKR